MHDHLTPAKSAWGDAREKLSRLVRVRPIRFVWLVGAATAVVVVFSSYLWFENTQGVGSLSAVQSRNVREFEAAVSRNPDDTRARLHLAYAYRQVGRYKDCIAQCDVIIDSEATSVAAYYNRGISHLQLKRDNPAEADLWKVLELEPGHVQAAVALGEYYAEKHQYRSLLVAVRPAVELHPEVAALQYLTGLSYEYTGHPEWASTRYRMALERSSNMVEAREGLKRLGAEQ